MNPAPRRSNLIGFLTIGAGGERDERDEREEEAQPHRHIVGPGRGRNLRKTIQRSRGKRQEWTLMLPTNLDVIRRFVDVPITVTEIRRGIVLVRFGG